MVLRGLAGVHWCALRARVGGGTVESRWICGKNPIVGAGRTGGERALRRWADAAVGTDMTTTGMWGDGRVLSAGKACSAFINVKGSILEARHRLIFYQSSATSEAKLCPSPAAMSTAYFNLIVLLPFHLFHLERSSIASFHSRSLLDP